MSEGLDLNNIEVLANLGQDIYGIEVGFMVNAIESGAEEIQRLRARLALAEKVDLPLVQRLFREVLRWRDSDLNDGFPHDTRLSIIEWLEKYAALLSAGKVGEADQNNAAKLEAIAWICEVAVWNESARNKIAALAASRIGKP